MSRQLYDSEPVYADTLDACAAVLDPSLDRPLLDVLFADEEGPDGALLNQTGYTQPALFAVEYGLAELWRSWGVVPDLVLGHSVGEIAALCVAGGISLEDGLRLVAARGRLMQELPSGGAMWSVRADEQRVQDAISGFSNRVAVAAINGPEHIVISGDADAVAEIAANLVADGVKASQLAVSHAFHSPRMEPMMSEYRRVAEQVDFARPRTPLVSGVDGRLAGEEVTSPDYWVRQIREPVRFTDALGVVETQAVETCLEIGPQPTLLALGRGRAPANSHMWLPSLRKDADDQLTLVGSLGALHTHGHTVDWEAFTAKSGGRLVGLPTYHFDRKRYWIDAQTPTDRVPSIGSAFEANDHLYEIEWRQKERADTTGLRSGDRRWLVLAEEGGAGRALAAEIASRGEPCLLALTGTAFVRMADGVFRVNPCCTADLEKLLDTCAPKPDERLGIVWLCARNHSHLLPAGDLPEQVLKAVDAVLHILQSLNSRKASCPGSQSLWLVTNGAMPVDADGVAEPLSLAEAPLWGLGRTAALESRASWGGLVDLDPSQEPRESVRLVTNELLADHPADQEVALRDGSRYVPRLLRRTLEGSTPVVMSGDGTYLITGGLGAIGLHIARWFVDNGARHLTLVGRRDRPEPYAQRQVRALRDAGAKVTILRADVAVKADVERLLAQTTADGLSLRGVVHAAGIDRRKPIGQLAVDDVRAVMEGKVRGAWLLHDGTKDVELDLFVCCSSIASVWGASERAHYSAANAFLDALVHERRRRGLPGLSVNWGPWAGGGMATQDDLAQLERIGNRGLTPQAAVAALGQLLSGNDIQVTVADIDWSRFREVHEIHGPRPFFEEIESATETTIGEPDSGKASSSVWVERLKGLTPSQRRRTLCEALRVEVARALGSSGPAAVRLDRGLFDMGLDSLIAVDLADSMRQRLGIEVSVLDFNQADLEALAMSLLPRFRLSEEPPEELDEAGTEPNYPNDATPARDGIAGYTQTIVPDVVAFQETAYPHRRRDWIADRWRWMFLESAKRMGVEPQVWVYRNADAIVGHHGAIPVKLKMNGQERVIPWLVESMVLEQYRQRAVGTQLLAQSQIDEPFSLSLGQAQFMRDIQFKMGWQLVGPLGTYLLPLDSKAVLRGKVKGPLIAWGAGQILQAATWLKRVSQQPRINWQPDVRSISRFGQAHDSLWESMSPEVTCSVVRDASYLNWKYVDQPGQQFDRLELYRDDELVSIAVLSFAEASRAYRYRRAFVVDLVLRPSDRETVWHTLNAVRSRARAKGADAIVMHLTSPALSSQLQHFGFLKREPSRVLLVTTNGLPKELVQTVCSVDNWYLTMGDSDIDRPWSQ